MAHASNGWPALEGHIAGSEILGFAFAYPQEYLDCIAWGDRDFDLGGDGHALAFLLKEEVAKDRQTFVQPTTSKRLVPFARGDNGDALFCFGGPDDSGIYVINLGDKPLRVYPTGFTNFVDFINDYRRQMGLAEWSPES